MGKGLEDEKEEREVKLQIESEKQKTSWQD